jgi:hypothetical protein
MSERLYIVETRHQAEECEQAFEDWERLKRNPDLPVMADAGFCYCPFGDHTGFLIVAGEATAQEVVRTYRAPDTHYRPIEAFPFRAATAQVP